MKICLPLRLKDNERVALFDAPPDSRSGYPRIQSEDACCTHRASAWLFTHTVTLLDFNDQQ